jgi:hypothetical protein
LTEETRLTEGASLAEAYKFIPSYGWLNTRYDAVNGRIQTMIAITSGFTFSGIALASALVRVDEVKPDYGSWSFVLAVFLAVCAIAVGLVGRTWGG